MIHTILVMMLNIILLGSFSYSQEKNNRQHLDSLYNLYLSLRGVETISIAQNRLINNENIKCGTFLINDLVRNLDSFSPRQQMLLKPFLQRPSLPNSIISPSGFFRIHFDTTGSDKIGYDLNLLSQALDSSYKFEVNYLGFLAPPLDNGEGGDNKYDVYVQNLGSYGQTVFETEVTPNSNKFTSYMEIDNDFIELPTKGINGARVTVAHELHHAIQGGSYIFRDGDRFFYELTSTSMEEFVYDDVNDYYFYLPSYFFSPEKAFAENDGYNLAIWNIYLKENFNFNIIKRQWELMPLHRALNAISTSIAEVGSSFKHELNRFGVWTHYTKHRAIPNKYFEEGAFYPLIKPLVTISFTAPDEVIAINSKATANNFIHVSNQINNDTLFIIVTNGDVVSAGNNISQLFTCTLRIYDQNVDGSIKLNDKYFAKLETDKPFLWLLSGEYQGGSISFPFPQPFSYAINYQQGQVIIIPVIMINDGNIDFYVYSSAMNLIYSKENHQTTLSRITGGYTINWNVLDNKNRKLASGIYIYVIKSGDDLQKGKLVILHD